MSKPKITLEPGTGLQLQLQYRGDERLAARVVGYYPNTSILVTTPRSENRIIQARIGQKVTVRYFSNTTACAFETEILNICTHPFHYLHLAFPSEVATDEVRKARRIDCELETKCSNPGKGGSRMNGVITNMSASGIGLLSDKTLGDIGDRIILAATLRLAHVQRTISVSGLIRSKHLNQKDVSTYVYGVEFVELTDEDFLTISSYVYMNLVEGNPTSLQHKC